MSRRDARDCGGGGGGGRVAAQIIADAPDAEHAACLGRLLALFDAAERPRPASALPPTYEEEVH